MASAIPFLVLLALALELKMIRFMQFPYLEASSFTRCAFRFIFMISILDVLGLSAFVRFM